MADNIEKISDAELEVLKVVWTKKAPSTYAEIRTALGGKNGWDSSTIRTLIRRLVEKSVLLQDKKDVYYYTPTIAEAEFIKARTKEFLRKVYGGDAKHLISTMLGPDVLSPDKREEVKEFWKRGRDGNE